VKKAVTCLSKMPLKGEKAGYVIRGKIQKCIDDVCSGWEENWRHPVRCCVF